MRKIIKNSIKTSLRHAKKIPYLRKKGKQYKEQLKNYINKNSQEIYEVSNYYPSIREYYLQSSEPLLPTDPLVSIILPTYNTPEAYLRECIESIVMQSYPKWELCIADDNSSDKKVIKIINEYQKKDERIKLIERPINGHISEASNSALELAKGDYIGLMDHDDVLWPNALYECVQVIRKNNRTDFIYSDEDKLDGTGKIHSYPFLKPDFSPEFLESCNYITHFSCIKTKIIKKVGGFRAGYEGAQDWDLFIRISEVTNHITHIPKILYSWRIHEASTASDTDAKPYVYEAQRKLLADHIKRENKKGVVETGIIRQHRTIKYTPKPGTLLTVVVRHKNFEATKKLIQSMTQAMPAATYEILFACKSVVKKDERDLFKKLLPSVKQTAIVAEIDNYKKVLEHANGSSLFFINGEGFIASNDWAKVSLAESQVKKCGFVFPVLLNKTGSSIMSAGVGVEYGKNGYEDMLNGMPFDDPHYSRGLYAKSRRNVSAGNQLAFVVERQKLERIIRKFKKNNFYDLCALSVHEGYRHIYTPYLQLHTKELIETKGTRLLTEDRYLNPNFNHENGRMEVAA